jgi:hypothetical protein
MTGSLTVSSAFRIAIGIWQTLVGDGFVDLLIASAS